MSRSGEQALQMSCCPELAASTVCGSGVSGISTAHSVHPVPHGTRPLFNTCCPGSLLKILPLSRPLVLSPLVLMFRGFQAQQW